MTDNRKSLIEKIRALLAKTAANGCTESEALSALDKARALMDAYEISDEELKEVRAEGATVATSAGTDKHGIRNMLGTAIAEFCDCRVWRSADATLHFCGLLSDAQLATWLLDTLSGFIRGELASHLMGQALAKHERTAEINGFVIGATRRISERLRTLAAQSKAQATSSNGRALVVVKTDLINEKMESLGLNLRTPRKSRRSVSEKSLAAGAEAGNRASFNRPIGNNSGALRIS